SLRLYRTVVIAYCMSSHLPMLSPLRFRLRAGDAVAQPAALLHRTPRAAPAVQEIDRVAAHQRIDHHDHQQHTPPAAAELQPATPTTTPTAPAAGRPESAPTARGGDVVGSDLGARGERHASE